MNRPALTLVELLASLVIVTMLVVAALGVTTGLARSELALRRQDETADGLDGALQALVVADLVHAHHWRAVKGGFSVQTNSRLTRATLCLEHVPSVVTYRACEVDDRSYLVRVQEAPPEPQQRGLAAVGATQVTFAPEKDVRPNRYGWKAITDNCTVRISFEADDGARREVEVRCLREGAG